MKLLQVAIALDQFGNVLLGGMADETVSARAYRCGWLRTQKAINWAFRDPNHCRDAYFSELGRKHLPAEYLEARK